MTKIELIKALSPYDDDDVVILSFGDGWSNIDTIIQDGSCINIKSEKEPIFSEN